MKKEVEVKEKVNENEERKVRPVITSRLLFISVLDKIYLVILFLILVASTYANFSGDMSSLEYGFWAKVFGELGVLIGIIITYFIFNWFYKCAVKTVLCLTETQVYKEEYWPLIRHETSIPLNKITRVKTIKIFWIFRSIWIFQYGKLPVIFFTWTNQEFKDELTKRISEDKLPVENKYEEKNILSLQSKLLKYAAIALAAVIALLGVVRFFNYIFSTERSIPGTYKNGETKIVLESDKTCSLTGIVSDDVTGCSWKYYKEEDRVLLTYEYTSGTYYKYNRSRTLDMKYSKKTLTYNSTEYKK